MKNKEKNAFTLIELIAVLVILAVIALIVTPLVMNIVKKAKDNANKRSVDAYGKATELAVATYLLDTGDYPTSLDNLTVEYSGNEVLCNVKILNEDGSVYLSECRVANKEVKDKKTDDGWYHYGKTINRIETYDEYNTGDTVTYNGMDFYVIGNSDSSNDTVTLLKAEPLTIEEVDEYGAGHINRYTYIKGGDAYGVNGYGGMAYYSSAKCGYISTTGWATEGCTTNYEQSEVKYAVDGWAEAKIGTNVLKEDKLGYKTRLITYDELINNLGCNLDGCASSPYNSWIYNNKYRYWTISQYNDSISDVWIVTEDGNLASNNLYDRTFVIRPVVTLLKSAIQN